MTKTPCPEEISSTEEYQILLASMPDGLIRVDSNGVIEYGNDQIFRLFGYTRDEIIGKNIEVLLPEELRASHVSKRNMFFNNPGRQNMGVNLDIFGQHKDGHKIPVDIALSPITETGGAVAVVKDLTEKAQMEWALRERAEELERSNRELEQFAYVASHDLQEPLRKIQAFGELLFSEYGESMDEEAQRYLSKMTDASQRMSLLIDNLLSFSRISTRDGAIDQVNLADCVALVIDDLQARIAESDAKIIYANLPTINANFQEMYQLFQNLISNGIKFQKGAETPTVSISATLFQDTRTTRYYQIKVEDNGIGFDEQYAPKAFGIFQRLHPKGEFKGTGIGLAICKRIVEKYGGKIQVQSKIGAGTTFTFTLCDQTPKNEGEIDG